MFDWFVQFLSDKKKEETGEIPVNPEFTKRFEEIAFAMFKGEHWTYLLLT